MPARPECVRRPSGNGRPIHRQCRARGHPWRHGWEVALAGERDRDRELGGDRGVRRHGKRLSQSTVDQQPLVEPDRREDSRQATEPRTGTSTGPRWTRPCARRTARLPRPWTAAPGSRRSGRRQARGRDPVPAPPHDPKARQRQVSPTLQLDLDGADMSLAAHPACRRARATPVVATHPTGDRSGVEGAPDVIAIQLASKVHHLRSTGRPP